MNRTRVTIFEDHALIAETLALSLRRRGLEAHVVTGDAVLGVLSPGGAAAFADDLVLLDLDLGVADGADLIDALCSAGARVVVLTGVEDPVRLGEALERGAEAVLGKGQPSTLTIETVLRCMTGQLAMAPLEREERLHDLELRRSSIRQTLEPFEHLTRTESEVLGLLMDGVAAADIAARRDVSLKTVHTQVGAILQKLGARSQVAAVAMAQRAGWRPAMSVSP